MPDSGRILSAYFKSGDFWNHKNLMSLCRLKPRHSEEEMTHALPLSNEKLGPLPQPVYFGCLQGEISTATLCNCSKLEIGNGIDKTHHCSFQYNQRLLTHCVIVALHSNSLDEHDIFDSREYWGNTLKLEVQLPYDDCSSTKVKQYFLKSNTAKSHFLELIL